jgi:acetylglutamate kinase
VNQKTAQPPDAAGVVLTFLESVGRRSEAELYLKLFRELPKESFAIIVAEAAVLRYAVGSLVEQLRFLRELGLFAPVAVGVFEPQSAEKAAARLTKRCADMGAVIEEARDAELAKQVKEELAAENLPVLSFAGTEEETTAHRFERLARLAGDLGTRKVVILRRRGGLRRLGRDRTANPDWERRVSVVNLRTDLAALSEPRALSADDGELLARLRELLERPEATRVVASVTSPLNLLRELFTVRGAGTLVKRGTSIERHASYEGLDIPRLSALLESSFGKTLDPGFFERPPLAVYLEEDYRAAAIIEQAAVAPYLTKFAVDRVAQGEGMGRDLWEAICRHHRSLFWRGRADNPIAGWYTSLCDGMMKLPVWTVYFRGIAASDVPAVVADAAMRPEDFLAPKADVPPDEAPK